MIKLVAGGILILLVANGVQAGEAAEKESGRDLAFRAMPSLSSNPTSGTGAGAIGTLIYRADRNSSPSQGILMAQYTNTDSYNIFAINKMFYGDDNWQSNTLVGILYNNSAYDFPADWVPPVTLPINTDDGIRYNVRIYVVGQQFLYRIRDKLYFGGQIFFVDQSFTGQNPAGELFLRSRGIENSQRGGYGLTLSYDTRTKREKFYPFDSTFINFNAAHFPVFMGVQNQYYNFTVNARRYVPGFNSRDVLALQAYGQYSSDNTPDGALAALGARNIIRGFPIGLYKARHMLAVQAEYRYRLGMTRFRVTAFAGYASLTGGSRGTGSGNRDKDNGDYYSGGFGVHYILERKQQLDYRINLAYTNEKEASIYASINQAF